MSMDRVRAIAACVAVSIPFASVSAEPQRDLRAGACPADQDGDGDMDIDDIALFVDAFIADAPGADIDNDGDADSDDIQAFVEIFISGDASGGDTDGDRLSDCAEAGAGTDPFVFDTDDDGLSDGDEVLGTITGVDLPAMGANPLRRTIFVETDWFAGSFEGETRSFRPTGAIVAKIQETFADAPLSNPDGSYGADIFIDYGQGGAFTGGNQLPGAPAYIRFSSDFNGYKGDHFDPAREGYFHYCILANRYNSASNGSSGVAEMNGDDFMVTLYGFFTTQYAAAAFVHEIGHNLGLTHGGVGGFNYMPNYNSVMNYRFTFSGVDVTGDAEGDGVIDYSSGLNVDLNEEALYEADGVNGFSPIDWNGNGRIDIGMVTRNVNCPEGQSSPCGTRGSCGDSSCRMLKDSDDWSRLNWQRLNDADGPSPAPFDTPSHHDVQIIECVDLIPG